MPAGSHTGNDSILFGDIWSSFSSLAGEWGQESGIQDQLAALDWVYKNIGNFGGDAERITVAGQSAGAISVQALLCADLSKRQIHQVIMQSGGGYRWLEKRSQTKEAALNGG